MHHVVSVYVPAFASTELYCSVTGGRGCEQLAQSHYAAALGWRSNSRPLDCKSDALPLCHHVTHCGWFVRPKISLVHPMSLSQLLLKSVWCLLNYFHKRFEIWFDVLTLKIWDLNKMGTWDLAEWLKKFSLERFGYEHELWVEVRPSLHLTARCLYVCQSYLEALHNCHEDWLMRRTHKSWNVPSADKVLVCVVIQCS